MKEQIVRARAFKNIRLISEQVAEFVYRPALCQRDHRVVVVRKNLSVEKGEQLKNGARAMQMPLDNLVSNWAYMVMASLAWSLKAWFALLLPQRGRWKQR